MKNFVYTVHTALPRIPALLCENHGGWYYEMQELGYNYRITDFQAALGISQLKRADMGLARRQEIARRYREGSFRSEGGFTPFCIGSGLSWPIIYL